MRELVDPVCVLDLKASQGALTTLIAGWKRDDFLMMASDTAAISGGMLASVEKLWPAGASLVWGYSGSEVYGKLVKRYMDGKLPERWEDLADGVKAATAAANKQARDDTKNVGGQDVSPTDLITVMVGGYLEQRFEIYEAHPSGQADFSPLPENYIGAAAVVAGANLATAVAKRLHASEREQLEAVMESVVMWQPFAIQGGVAGPIDYWRISKDGSPRRWRIS